jgi:DNA-binding LytR/AlgR family response regulator
METTQSFKCLIIDDEPQARNVLRRHIAALDMLQLVGECPNAIAAFQVLQQEAVDVMFLDISMPQVSGLEFLRSMRQPPKTIITTAHREFALDGFELDVADYLLKPVSFERFLKALQKAFRHVPLPVLAPADDLLDQDPFLYFKVDRRMVKVLLQDLLYIESLKDYVRLVTTQQSLVTKTPLSTVASMLPPGRFIRVHRSFIINLDHVAAYTASSVQMASHALPVGRMYRDVWEGCMQRLEQ